MRNGSPLLGLQTEADVMGRLKFYNTGPSQVLGLIVMSLSDKVPTLPDLDPAREQIVVLFNATDGLQMYTIAELAGQGFRLDPVQTNSADPVVRGPGSIRQTGAFTVASPARPRCVVQERRHHHHSESGAAQE
jgi:hypothetical protein